MGNFKSLREFVSFLEERGRLYRYRDPINKETEVVPFRPSLVGQAEPEAVMGKGSGSDNCKHWLDKFQIQANDEQAVIRVRRGYIWGYI